MNETALSSSRRGFLGGLALAAGAAPALAQPRRRSPSPDKGLTIKRVTAIPLLARYRFRHGGLDKPSTLGSCYVEIETANGLIGHGLTSYPSRAAFSTMINQSVAGLIIGDNAMNTEAIWEKMYWLTSPRGQTGLGGHAMGAVDIALWDIKGKALGLPIATLLGGARGQVPAYATFGPASLKTEELGPVAKDMVARGYKGLKMVVGDDALRDRDRTSQERVLRYDVARVKAVRDAVGDGPEIGVDANCNYDLAHAEQMVRAMAPYNVAFFEEPITQNDVQQMAELRRRTGAVVTAGQNEALAFRFRDMLVAGAVDQVQPNVMNTGGFTQCAKILGMAEAFNIPVSNGGAGALFNMHLLAGLKHGGPTEWHLPQAGLTDQLYPDAPQPVNGVLTVPDRPGLGFDPDRDQLRDMTEKGP